MIFLLRNVEIAVNNNKATKVIHIFLVNFGIRLVMAIYNPMPEAEIARATNCMLAFRSKVSLRINLGMQAILANINEIPTSENLCEIMVLSADICLFTTSPFASLNKNLINILSKS
jgi:hypothetical protein